MTAGQPGLPQLEALAIEAIRTAFRDGEPPEAEQMDDDHCSECSETSARFVGRRWQDVRPVDLLGNPSVSLLPMAGFRYLLPAFLLCCIEAPHELDCVPNAIVGFLSPPNGKPGAQLAELVRGLDRAQTEAVVAFLRVIEARESREAELLPGRRSRGPARALAYWSTLVTGVPVASGR